MEIPSSADGEVSEVLVKVGDKVSRGSVIVKLTGALAAAVPSAGRSCGSARPCTDTKGTCTASSSPAGSGASRSSRSALGCACRRAGP